MLRDGRPMGELAGRTILVVGYGRIGTRVARLCAAFGMNVMVRDPAFPVPRIAADGFTPVTDIAAALPEIDVLTLHCPLGEDTRHMINREMLGLMKPTAWLINAARGPLVDEAALIEALSSGKLEAAGLDVQLHEPPDPANPLLQAAQRGAEPAQRRSTAGVQREDVDPCREEHAGAVRRRARSRLRGQPGDAAEPAERLIGLRGRPTLRPDRITQGVSTTRLAKLTSPSVT